jgi:tetratricopeptide (TPR) repeat protein
MRRFHYFESRRLSLAVSCMATVLLLTGSRCFAEAPRSVQAMTAEVIRLHRDGKLKPAISLAALIADRVETELGRGHIRFAQALNNLAILYDDANRPTESEKLYLRAISIVEAQPIPVVFQLVELKNNLGAVLLKQCRLNDSKKQFEEALELSREALGDYHRTSAMIRVNLRQIAIAEGRSERKTDVTKTDGLTPSIKPSPVSSQAPIMGLLRGCMS